MYKKITVVGGSGFVGTNLCQRLTEQNTDFEIIDIRQSRRFPEKFSFGDVRDVNSLRKSITGDIVVNLAAVHRDDVRDKLEYLHTNVNGAKNIALVCNEKNIDKIVFTSSVAVYGFVEHVTDEDGNVQPFNEYGRTKLQAEQVLREWQKMGDKSLIIVRPTVIFGEGNRGNVFNLFYQIYSGRFIMIGSGKNKKSMAYIGNVIAFLEQCIGAQVKLGVYNYVDTPDFDMNSLVRKVRATVRGKQGVGIRIPFWIGSLVGHLSDAAAYFTRRKFPISSIRIKKFCATTQFSSAKRKLGGFEPPFSLEEGIERTLQSEFISPDPKREIFFTE